MALFKFTKAIMDGTPIDVYNRGNMNRDFTYIDDLVQAVTLLYTSIKFQKAFIRLDLQRIACPLLLVSEL